MKTIRSKIRGQPTKYRPEMCERLIELGRIGMSLTAASVALGVSDDSLSRWADKHPDFGDAMREYKRLNLAWWEEQGRTHLVEEPGAPKFNHVLWYMNMKNRHGWADKQELKADISIDIADRLQRAIDRLNAAPAD